MRRDPAYVILVGRRNGARRAARRLDIQYSIIDPDKGESAPGHLPQKPDAVIAVTESAVVPAAQLRADLGVAGHGMGVAQRCTNKVHMKQAVSAAGVACAKFLVVPEGSLDAKSLVEALGLPVVIKPAVGSGGRDSRVAQTLEHLPASIVHDCIAESYIDGVEMSIESLVVGGRPVFVNYTDYVEPAWANLVPAVLPEDTAGKLRDLNRRAISALGIERGMTHLEVFLTSKGPVFGELGARPPGGQIMKLIEMAYGFDPWEALMNIELGRPVNLPEKPKQFAGMRFFHPDAGRVVSILGLEAAAALPSVEHLDCKLRAGDTVKARVGTGQHCGFALLAGTQAAVRRDLEAVRRLVRFELEERASDLPWSHG